MTAARIARWIALASVLPTGMATGKTATRKVELLEFGREHRTSFSTEATLDTPADEASNDSLGNSLATGFSSSGDRSSPTQMQRTTIAVPLWMKTGVTPGQRLSAPGDLAAPALYAPFACMLPQYRPRRDLSPVIEARRERLYPMISTVACETGVPVALFDALIAQESRYNATIISSKGAIGLTQLMPGTSRQLEVSNPWDPLQNLRGGARYLRQHLDEFRRVDLALAAYNAGPGRIRSLGRIPPYRETIDYVSTITRAWESTFQRVATVSPIANRPFSQPALSPYRTARLFTYTLPKTANPM